MRFLFLLMAGVTSAFAETNLFNDGTWLIDGATDVSPNPSSINILIDRQPAGAFSELRFFFNMGSNRYEQVFAVKGNGTWVPSLPAPGVVGGAFRLTSYWDCEQGFIEALAVTELGWKSKGSKKGLLELTGKLANHNSLESDKLKVTFLPVVTNFLRAELEYDLKATRDFCIDTSRHETQEEFRAVSMISNYISPIEHANDLAKQLKVTEKICAGIYGCYTKKESFCVSLTNSAPGFLVKQPHRLGSAQMQLVHTSDLPRPTPSLSIFWYSPNRGAIKPQGFYLPTDDPLVNNVEVWGNWLDVKKDYKAGQKVGKFSLALEASPPGDVNCDSLQNSTTP